MTAGHDYSGTTYLSRVKRVPDRLFPNNALASSGQSGWVLSDIRSGRKSPSVRAVAHLARDRDELILLRHKWLARIRPEVPGYYIARFKFDGMNRPPLSGERLRRRDLAETHVATAYGCRWLPVG